MAITEKLERERAALPIDEMLLPDNQSLQIKVSLSGLFRIDSMVPDNNNNLSSAFDDPFFDQNQENPTDNDNYVDNQMLFQDEEQPDLEMIDTMLKDGDLLLAEQAIMEEPKNGIVKMTDVLTELDDF